MKTKYWILLIAVLLAVCVAVSIPLLMPAEDALYAEVISDGQVLRIVDLKVNQEFTVDTKAGGRNRIVVSGGKIGVVEATCPDHYCMDRGMCSSGAQIVCLPNKLVIRFQGTQAVDTVVG